MAKRKQPMITREDIIAAALRVIDAEGLEGLSMRRIGAELDINAASLYYHFKNKDAILEEVARFVLRNIRTPATPPDDWMQACLDMVESFRVAMMVHPNVLELLALRVDHNFSPSGVVYATKLLENGGIPTSLIPQIHEAMRALAIGAIMVAIADRSTPAAKRISPTQVDDAQRLANSIRALLTGFAQLSPEFDETGPTKRRRRQRLTA